MAEVHYVKSHTPVFREIKNGDKQFQIKNDVNYEVGDTLIFEEINNKGKDTGAWSPKLVTSKTDTSKGIVILGLQEIKF